MHVCFASLPAYGAFCPGMGRIGGAEIQVRRLSEYLVAECGWRVTVVVGDEGQPDEETRFGVRLLKVAQPPRSGGALGRLRRKTASALGLVRVAKSAGADIYVQQSSGIETGLTARAARQNGKPFVFMSANDWEFEPPWSAGGGITGIAFRAGLRSAAMRLVQTEHQAARMREVFDMDSEILYNIFNFSPSPRIPKARAIIWVGRCREQKQPLKFIGMMRRLPDIPAIMVAAQTPYEPELFAQTKAAAKALPHCEWIPGLPCDQMEALYARGSILVNTSSHEGVPNTFIEAADAGLALATLNVDPHGMIRGGGAGFCAQGDIARLADATAKLFSDDDERLRLALKAREWLAERHDYRRVGSRFAALLEKAAAHAR